MAQRGIHHQHGGGRAFHGGDAPALVDSPLLHAQSTAVEIGHRTDLRGAGIENFLSCSCSPGSGCFQQVIQVLLRILTGKDDITLLPDGDRGAVFCLIGIILIQIHRSIGADIDRIVERDTLPRCGRKRYLIITTTVCINTAQAVGIATHLGILVEFH